MFYNDDLNTNYQDILQIFPINVSFGYDKSQKDAKPFSLQINDYIYNYPDIFYRNDDYELLQQLILKQVCQCKNIHSRKFYIGESVFYSANLDVDVGNEFGIVVSINNQFNDLTLPPNDFESTIQIRLKDTDKIVDVLAIDVYQVIDTLKTKDGLTICLEHNQSYDYPYYCPELDENLYSFEVFEKSI